jgi:8-amino-7-oxononanoate synthase
VKTILVTGSDTGVGKTLVVAALARLVAANGGRVQIVKILETGTAALPEGGGDAARACRLAGGEIEAFTLASFPLPLSPPAAAAAAGALLALETLVKGLEGLPPCDWRVCEGAGGIATPVDDQGRDWADLAAAMGAQAVVIVVPDRLGAINQARLAYGRAREAGLHAGVWLNATAPVDPAVAESNRQGLRAAQVPIWAEQAHGAEGPADPESLMAFLAGEDAGEAVDPGRDARPGASGLRRDVKRARTGGTPVPTHVPVSTQMPVPTHSPVDPGGSWLERCRSELADREKKNRRRRLRVTTLAAGELNLADNDYLALARDPAVVAAASAALARDGASSSASPLITGWREPHEALVQALGAWHGFPCGLLWSSGYAANSAVLGTLPRAGDLVLADRLVHHSIVAGMLRSGARVQRYAHLRLDELERRLIEARGSGYGSPPAVEAKGLGCGLPQAVEAKGLGRGLPRAVDAKGLGFGLLQGGQESKPDSIRSLFVVTESLFSMDGDYPDLGRLADLKRRYGFCWILDEAHALGWYGLEGAGLARAAGVEGHVDVLVGTLGKALASGGAYTLFRDETVRDYLINQAGEFIYSTALPPANAAAAQAALERIRALAAGQAGWHASSRAFRAGLRAAGWTVPEGESPIVPVRLDDEEAALSLADFLRAEGIRAGAVRPPTVPAGTSRLRFSLKRTFGQDEGARVLAAMAAWRKRR